MQQRRFEVGHFLFQPAGEDRQTHDLNETDVFFFDVVQLLVWMVEAQRVFFCRQIIPQHEVKLVLAVPHPRDRRDGVVRLAVGLREDHRVGVRIAAPLRQDFARKVAKLLLVRRAQAQHRHRVLYDAAVHIFKARDFKAKLLLCLLHREAMMSALKMLMRQNAAADDRKVGI